MLELRIKKAFKQDQKRLKHLLKVELRTKIDTVIQLLLNESTLPDTCHNHALIGNYQSCYECHILPDLLLIYQLTDEAVILVRLGTHNDLFNK